MTKKSNWFLLIVAAAGYCALVYSTYVVSYLYVIFKAGSGFSAAQLGKIASVVGIVALTGYLFGGILSDIISTKRLLVLSHCLLPGILIYLSTFPSFKCVLAVQAFLTFICVFLYWTPITRFIQSLGPGAASGRRFGFFYSMVAVCGMIMGLLAVFLIDCFDGQQAMRFIYYLFAGLNCLSAAVIFIMYQPEQNADRENGIEADRFEFRYLFQILSLPSVWLMGIMGFSCYSVGKVMVYITPYLQDSYGLSLSTATLINSVANYGVAAVIAPLAGLLTDKLKSATKMLSVLVGALSVTMVILLIVPAKRIFTPLLVFIAFLVAGYYAIFQAEWIMPASEIKYPAAAKGTLIGVVSLMIYCSDAFTYNIFGGFVTKYGTAGYHKIFLVIFLISMVGNIAAYILRKRIKEEST